MINLSKSISRFLSGVGFILLKFGGTWSEHTAKTDFSSQCFNYVMDLVSHLGNQGIRAQI